MTTWFPECPAAFFEPFTILLRTSTGTCLGLAGEDFLSPAVCLGSNFRRDPGIFRAGTSQQNRRLPDTCLLSSGLDGEHRPCASLLRRCRAVANRPRLARRRSCARSGRGRTARATRADRPPRKRRFCRPCQFTQPRTRRRCLSDLSFSGAEGDRDGQRHRQLSWPSA